MGFSHENDVKPHFRLLSLDGHENSSSDSDRGNLIYPCGQYCDIFSNHCKNNLLDTYENDILSDFNSTYFKRDYGSATIIVAKNY